MRLAKLDIQMFERDTPSLNLWHVYLHRVLAQFGTF